jgi:TPP-dependent pyruvate/acetoin dehydrogenase alpha subunit
VDDWVTLTHRGHGQALAKGVSAKAMMAELFARETGCCRGFGGSLHVGDISVGAVPAIAIVGAAVPIAAGIALGFRDRGEDRVALCFLGDGAMTEGDTHEGLNLAALWQLPVIYLCENNYYSVSTPVERQMRTTNLAARAGSYGMATGRVDGNDVVAVLEATRAAVARAREGAGPTFIEALTYRQGGHKRDDPAAYRSPDEVQLWLARDPIKRMRAGLEVAGLGQEVEAAEQAAVAAIDEAVAFAESSPLARFEVVL